MKNIIDKIKNAVNVGFKGIYITSKFLFVIGIMCFIIISFSVFIPELDATGNVVTIRTLFSSIVGFVLESSTRKLFCDDTFTMLKNCFIGVIAIIIIIILAATVVLSIDVNNPSLLLLKNTLFSCVGFLISTTKECE